jgi:hypothetical protein
LLVIADGRIKMKIEVKLHSKWLRALLPALMVLALGACSSTEETPSDTSGETGQEVDCSTRIGEQAQQECEWAQEQAN